MQDYSPKTPAATAVADNGGIPKRVSPCTAVNVIDETLEIRLDPAPVIDRFELIERIGAGAFGTVWRAHDRDLDRQVAIKVPRAAVPDEVQSKRFLQEARLASQLKHPGIVGVHEVGRFGESFYIVSDYIEGQTLGQWLQQRSRMPCDVAHMCRSLALAIAHAHEAGVVHRDLKPSNILVDAEDAPHITDFGLARRTADDVTLTADGQILGTPAYMSPEQVTGNRQQIDHRADIYALGVVLFEMLTGEPPFRGSVQILIHQVLASEAPRPRGLSSSVPRDLENICMKCLEKDPRRRYQSATALADDLERFLASKPVLARPIPSYVRCWRWSKRNRLATSVTAVLFLVLSAGIAISTSQWLRAEAAAARETQTLAEVEQLTQQMLELAGRLQQLEDRQPQATSMAWNAKGVDSDASLSYAVTSPQEHVTSPQEQTELSVPQQQVQLQPRTRFFRSLVKPILATDGPARPHDRIQSRSELEGLQADAQLTLQRLERVSPALAQQCRGAFPRLAGD